MLVCGLIMCEKKYHMRVHADTFNLPLDISYASAADIDLTQPLAIGCRVVYGRSNDLYFNGAIDDVMIFDRELSSDEIKAMYNRGFSLGWDDNGNMTANDMINGTDTTLQYNWDNKLRSATKGAKSISLRYDPGGNRIWKQSIDGAAETTHKYIVDIVGGLPTTLMEIEPNIGLILKTYIYANGQVLCRHDGDYSSARYFYIHDRLGSTRQIINTSGSVVRYYTYEPFGEVLEEEGTLTNNMMFTGQYFDTEIDQYYLRARQYDPYISRFTARDPVFGRYKEPLTLHRYLYCFNDPVNLIDPWGLDSVGLYDGTGDGGIRGLQRLNAANDFDWAFHVSSPEYAAELVTILSTIMEIEIDDLYIFDHGYAGVRNQGKQEIGDEGLNWGSDAWKRIASSVEKEGTIHLRGCNIASGNKLYIWLLAQTGGRKVDAFDNLTYLELKESRGPDYFSHGDLWLAVPGLNPVFNISKGSPWSMFWPFRRW